MFYFSMCAENPQVVSAADRHTPVANVFDLGYI